MMGALLPYVNDTMSELTELKAGDDVEMLKEGGAWNDDETIVGTVVDMCEPEPVEWADNDRSDEIVVVETEDGDTREISTDNGQFTVVEVASGSDDEQDDNDDDDELEVAADGGEDVTEHVDDSTIEDAIKQHDDPEHEDALTVDDIRDLLAHVQVDTEAVWSEWMDNIERGDTTVVAQDGDLLVLDTGEHDTVSRALETYDGPVTVDDIAERVVSTVHHRAAENIDAEYNWGCTHPRVVRLPADGEAGQQFAEAVVNGLQRRGLSPGQAWAHYGVEIRQNSMNSWGKRKGDADHKNVSDALKKARQKLP